jgi:putative ABC transport system permease protein
LRDPSDAPEIAGSIKSLYKEIDAEATLELQLQPLLDVHLKSPGGGGRIVYVYTFSMVAALLLIVGCINFVNLATARATQRAKEIGVRKSVGASRWQLGVQVTLEQVMQTTLAMMLAVTLLEFSLPRLAGFFGKTVVLNWSLETLVILLGVSLATGLAAGIYPALVLSSFRPALTLRASRAGSRHGSVGVIRKALVVFQFAVSAGLIFASLIISQQMDYIQNKDLGINRDNILCLSAGGLDRDYRSFERELEGRPGIETAAAVFNPPAWVGCSVTDFDFDGKAEDHSVTAVLAMVDYNYVDVFGLNILEGRNFSEEFSTDIDGACLINESAARAMGMDQSIGRGLEIGDGKSRTIVGVVKDFHYASLRSQVDPLILVIDEAWLRTLCIKLDDDDVAAGLASVEQTFNTFRPGTDFSYRFFDEFLSREYRIEKRTKDIALAFTAITTIIAILGLLGLAASSVERRTKEIGIRKTLGASAAGIIKLVTREFMILILIGNVIVAPVAYYFVHRWLENFAYRVEPGLGSFFFAAFITVAGAWVAISFKALQAARTNPVEALKYE